MPKIGLQMLETALVVAAKNRVAKYQPGQQLRAPITTAAIKWHS